MNIFLWEACIFMELYCNRDASCTYFVSDLDFFKKKIPAQKTSSQNLAFSSQCPVDMMTRALLRDEEENIFPVSMSYTHISSGHDKKFFVHLCFRALSEIPSGGSKMVWISRFLLSFFCLFRRNAMTS